MFEGIISDAINKFLGKFVDGIDPAQLKGTKLLSGAVTLKDLKVSSSLFDASPLPFKFLWGKVGRIYLKIPIWDMFKSPLEIEVEDIVILVGIKPITEWNEELQKQAFMKQTQMLLDQFELFMRQTELIEQTQLLTGSQD